MKKTNTQIRHWQKGSRRVGHCGATDGSIRDVSAKAFHDSRKAPFCSVCARLAWEAGRRNPGPKHLAKLAEVLGLEIADLLPRIQPDLGANQ